jgi:PKD domain
LKLTGLFFQSREPIDAAVILVLLLLPLLGFLLAGIAPANDSSSDDECSAHILANNPPSFALDIPLNIYPTTDVPFNMSIKVADLNNDTVNVTWEWGDGSPNATDVTPPALTAVWVNQTHTWSVPREPGVGGYTYGPYLVNITLDDGMGGTTRRQKSAYVYVPPNEFPEINLSAPTNAEPGEEVLIVAEAKDAEGDPLTWTFVFNDTVSDFYTEVLYSPASGPNETMWNNITYAFGVEGSFTVRLDVSDALPPNQIFPHNISQTVPITIKLNQIPQAGAIDTSPQSLIINGTLGYLEVNYSLEAYDTDGDVLNITWDFGDGSPTVTNQSFDSVHRETFIQVRNYTDPGTFNISVVVSDGRPGHDVLLYKEVQITSNNLPPSMVSFSFNYSENRSYGLPNETILFTLSIADPELNAIQIMVDFGDNSSVEYYNLTDFVGGNVTFVLNHSYSEPREYQITITYTDNKIGLFEHSKTYNITVSVKVTPPIVHYYWRAFDYISLAVLISVLVFPIIWAFIGMRRRKRMDMEGASGPVKDDGKIKGQTRLGR